MSNITPFQGETPDNFNTRCLCVLVLDTSYSMEGDPINELNKGLLSFGDFLKSKNSTRFSVETSIITFNSEVECVQEPALVDEMQSTSKFPLQVDGTTKLVDGVRAAIKKVEDRKQWYRNNGIAYYRPWVVLITDGYPDKDQDIDGLANEIKIAHNGKHFAFLPMGVEGADPQFLSKIATSEFPPLPIDWQKFQDVFQWLSNSLDKVSQSAEGEKVTFGSVQDFTRTGWGGGDFTQTPI
ncbi:MAG: VWA domain-containing protein [Bacteroidetes bacterium]|nr:VWA domain-containing protein [Bacteroidota bacterium]